MDTNTGRVYSSFEHAAIDGADKDNIIQFDVHTLESNKMLLGVLRFLLTDNAFDREFLVTAILEYICNSSKSKDE